ncbi:MAG: tagaturonate reductase [Kiritimatiellia bacterium]
MDTKILQFGEGNFLRCFIDWMVQKMNDRAGFGGAVQIIQPIGDELSAPSKALNARGGRYHTCLRGVMDGRQIEEIEAIAAVTGVDMWQNATDYATLPSLRFVVSNTTEAGIQYVKGQNTFPFKVYRLLKARFAAGLPGLVFLPCELIERNGDRLKECVLRYAADAGDADLAAWIARACVFCSTLVDRIVAGRPDPESAERYARQLGERDDALVCGEPFHFLAVETPAGFDLEAEFPLRKAGVNVVYTSDLRPYRTRKLRFLNAAHTTIVYWGLERGFAEVAQVVDDPDGRAFLRKLLFEEIYPTVDLPDAEKTDYANSVLERFANPFAHHRLSSIALNTIAKWQTRCLPVVCDYFKLNGRLPACMMQGYEAIARHYDNLT